ncbi:MAG: hypothetical protein KDK34_05535 [Leptospiraceae bacterium]|nr:hypothetical protein [Leptospiraceae bacterium]
MRKPYVAYSLWIALLVFLTFLGSPQADTVTLRDGTVHDNVRTFVGSGYLYIVFKDGTVEGVPKSSVRSLRRADVDWSSANIAVTETDETETGPPSEDAEAGLRDPFDLAWRSAVFPGWGHFHAEEYWLGGTYMFLFFSAAAYAIAQQSRLSSVQNDYNSQTEQLFFISSYITLNQRVQTIPLNLLVNQQSFSEYQSQASKTSTANLALLGIYLIQLTHAYLTGVDWVNEAYIDQTADRAADTGKREAVHSLQPPPTQAFGLPPSALPINSGFDINTIRLRWRMTF